MLPSNIIGEAQDGLQHLQSFWMRLIQSQSPFLVPSSCRSTPGFPELLECRSPPGAVMPEPPWQPLTSAHAHRAAWPPLCSACTAL